MRGGGAEQFRDGSHCAGAASVPGAGVRVSAAEIGITIGLFGFGRLVTSLPAGYLAQRYGRKGVLGLGAAINVVGAAMGSVSFSYAWLTGWRFVSGFGGSIFLTVATIYLRDEATPETRGRLLSLQELSILAGQTLGPVLGGYIADIFGLRVPLYVQAVLMAVSLGVIVLALPESRWREEAARRAAEAGGRAGQSWTSSAAVGATTGCNVRVDAESGVHIYRDVRADDSGESPGSAVQRDAIVWPGEGVQAGPSGFVDQRYTLSAVFHDAGFGLPLRPVREEDSNHPIHRADMVAHSGVHLGRQPVAAAAFGGAAGVGRRIGESRRHGVFRGHCAAGHGGSDDWSAADFRRSRYDCRSARVGAIADVAGFPWALWVDAATLTAAALGLMVFVRETYRARRS